MLWKARRAAAALLQSNGSRGLVGTKVWGEIPNQSASSPISTLLQSNGSSGSRGLVRTKVWGEIPNQSASSPISTRISFGDSGLKRNLKMYQSGLLANDIKKGIKTAEKPNPISASLPTHQVTAYSMLDPSLTEHFRTGQMDLHDYIMPASFDLTEDFMIFNPLQFCKTNALIQLKKVPGQKEEITVVSDYGKSVERSLISQLLLSHKLHRCFKDLTVNDLYLRSNGTVKLNPKVQFTDLTPEGIDQDFARASNVLHLLLTASNQKRRLPDDQKKLLKIMKDRASTQVYLIATNTALLPMSIRPVAMRRIHGLVFRMLSEKDREHVIEQIKKVDWQKKALRNYYLRRCIKYRQIHKAYNTSMKDILDLHRNFDGHQFEQVAGRMLEIGDSELIQYAHYPVLLSDFQQCLWYEDCLGRLCLEELFGEEMVDLMKDQPKSGSRPSK